MTPLICFGFGYCAEHFVAAVGSRFERIVGTVRQPNRAGILNAYQSGTMHAVVFDGVRIAAELESAIAAADYALISVPPDASGDLVLAACGDVLAAARNLRSVVYLSTVGVYGDYGGGSRPISSAANTIGSAGGPGSSSAILNTPVTPRSKAASIARAISPTWMRLKTWPGLTTRRALPRASATSAFCPGP